MLGINLEPHDIDMTLAADPEDINTRFNTTPTDDTSLFRTEKFGTVTLSRRVDEQSEFVYELTPFREESTYSDHRHPDTLTWSNSLVSDAKRRDFTINALYYSSF